MNIVHLLSGTAKFPLKAHHGRFEWVLRLARAQAAKGHKVTVYCAPGSGKDIAEISWASSPYDFENITINDAAMFKTALADTTYDIYHSHFDFLHYFFADLTTKPVVFTQHWFPYGKIAQAATFNASKNVLAVPVTAHMRRENQKLHIPTASTIYHGINLEKFSFSSRPRSDRFVFVGRIAPHKDVQLAVTIAKATGNKLDIVGKINDQDQPYWQTILPAIDGEQIRYLGPKSQEEVAKIFSNAKALLFPSTHIEAFGQVIIEAQACGTPAIVSDVGASRELVENGKTGFVAKTDADFASAIQRIDTIEPAACRKHAEKFNIQKMVDEYDTLYQELLDR